MKPLTMPDNGWTEEEKATALDALFNQPIPEQPVNDEPSMQECVGRALWGEPEVVASNGQRTAIPMRKYTTDIGGSDAEQ